MNAPSLSSSQDTTNEYNELEQLRAQLQAMAEREAQAQHDLAEYQARFVAALTHDLKNPLTTIMGRIEMLKRLVQRAEIAPADVERHLVPLDEAVNRLQHLLHSASLSEGAYTSNIGSQAS